MSGSPFTSEIAPLLLGLSLLFCSGCSTLSYLFQAGKGQLAIMNRARPIPEVLKDERVPPRIKALLSDIPAIKKYGEENGLKPTANYREYVQLDGSAASWVVSACEPLRFKSKEWHFPIVGSFPYLGWFNLDQAKDYAEGLKAEGWDVDLRGARAYSTLGWFRDPVVSSMISDGDDALGELVNVVLHESVHATFYVQGQAYFDESIASFVADGLTVAYLDRFRGPASKERISYVQAEKDWLSKQKKLHAAYEKLSALYSSAKPDEKKKNEKEAILTGLKADLKFSRALNNATIIQYKTYHVGHDEFTALYNSCGKSWPRFWGAIRRIGEKSFSKPQQEDLGPVVMPLAKDGCPQSPAS